jgi:acetyltransferase-like isoleucine patch superfamily enzyme
VDDRKWWIKTRTPEAREIVERVKVATRLSAELSAFRYDEPEQVHRAFEELIGKSVDSSLSLIPPFYADHGLNITVGRKVHIGYGCMFTGHAPIDIADDVMIANKTNLVAGGHPVPPDQRRDHLTGAPITIERNVWIGTAATILQGVTIGADSVVAAGAVVTRDVPSATLVAGVPATVVRDLESSEAPLTT